jgi:hypothetical protein
MSTAATTKADKKARLKDTTSARSGSTKTRPSSPSFVDSGNKPRVLAGDELDDLEATSKKNKKNKKPRGDDEVVADPALKKKKKKSDAPVERESPPAKEAKKKKPLAPEEAPREDESVHTADVDDKAALPVTPAKRAALPEVKKAVSDAQKELWGSKATVDDIADKAGEPLAVVKHAIKRLRDDQHKITKERRIQKVKKQVELAEKVGLGMCDQQEPIFSLMETQRLLRMLPFTDGDTPSVSCDEYKTRLDQRCVPVTTMELELVRVNATQVAKRVVKDALARAAADATPTSRTLKIQAHHIDQAVEAYQPQMRWPTKALSFGMALHGHEQKLLPQPTPDATNREELLAKRSEAAQYAAVAGKCNAERLAHVEQLLKKSKAERDPLLKRQHLRASFRAIDAHTEEDLAPLDDA